MTKSKRYSGSDIRVLTDIQHVRKRTPIYLGSVNEATFNIPIFTPEEVQFDRNVTFVPAMMKAFSEVIDNAVDELTQINDRVKTIDITVNGKDIEVSDSGRGIPIDKHPSGKWTPEVALTQLRAGRNFEDEKVTGVIGMNGVGVAATAMCSTKLAVTILRDGKSYHQVYKDGTEDITPPKIKPHKSATTGTSVTFSLDAAVFGTDTLPIELIRNRAYEVALTNPDITVKFNGTKIRYKNGFDDLLKSISNDLPCGYFKFETAVADDMVAEFFIVPNMFDTTSERVYTWVNSSLLFDGGMCNTQLINALNDKVIAHLQPAAKKNKSTIIKQDITQGLLVFGNIKMARPEYDSQAKTRLTGPNIKRQLVEMIDSQWSMFTKKQGTWLTSVLDRAIDRHHAHANRQATKNHEKRKNTRVEGLVDATSKLRERCSLYITEGQSAAETIVQARDPMYQGSFPLTGKINNTWGCKPAEVLSMPKVADMLVAAGLTPGKPASPSTMRFGKIVLATDSDQDGAHIIGLEVMLFYNFWPELFDPKNPKIFRLIAPNIVAVRGQTRVHFPTLKEFEKVSHKYGSGWTMKYMKGLGSMTHVDWKTLLTDESASLVPIVDDGKLADSLTLHFGPDAGARREWLMS